VQTLEHAQSAVQSIPGQAFGQPPSKTPTLSEETAKDWPNVYGVSSSIAKNAGQLAAHPEFAPLMFEEASKFAIMKLLNAGFTASMLGSSLDTLKETIPNWDNLTPAEKAERVTDFVITSSLAAHQIEGMGKEPVKAGIERAKDLIPSKETALAPVRVASKGLSKIQPILPTAIGAGLGEVVGHPYWGGVAGSFALRPEVLDSWLARGRTAGQPKEVADVAELTRDHAEAVADQQKAQRAYDKHSAGQERGIPAPEKIIKAKEKADQHLQLITDHLKAAREALEEYKSTPPASTGPIELSPEQRLEQDTRLPKAPTNEELKARQERLISDIEAKAPAYPEGTAPLIKAEPAGAIPSISEAKPEPAEVAPLIPKKPATAEEMRSLKAVGGKVVEDPYRAAFEGSREAKPVAVKAGGMPRIAPTEPQMISEPAVRHAERPATEPGLLGHEKEFANEGRSPEDTGKAEGVVYQLPNQDLQRLGTRFGLDESRYDFTKREAVREGGSKHTVDRDRFHKDLMAKLPDAFVDKLVEAEAAWDKANPQTFDAPARSSKFWADRSRTIVKDAMTRYQDDLASKGQGGGSAAATLIPNASIESAASLEAINRAASEKRQGTKYYRVDSRSGIRTPLPSIGAVDAVAGPYEHIVKRVPDGETVLDSGKYARPLRIRPIYDSGGVVPDLIQSPLIGSNKGRSGQNLATGMPQIEQKPVLHPSALSRKIANSLGVDLGRIAREMPDLTDDEELKTRLLRFSQEDVDKYRK